VFKRGNTLVGDAKDFKEIDPERLALAVLIGSICPCAAESERAGFDFVPGEGHGQFLVKSGLGPRGICTASYQNRSKLSLKSHAAISSPVAHAAQIAGFRIVEPAQFCVGSFKPWDARCFFAWLDACVRAEAIFSCAVAACVAVVLVTTRFVLD
jgi:hypothetical protein